MVVVTYSWFKAEASHSGNLFPMLYAGLPRRCFASHYRKCLQPEPCSLAGLAHYVGDQMKVATMGPTPDRDRVMARFCEGPFESAP